MKNLLLSLLLLLPLAGRAADAVAYERATGLIKLPSTGLKIPNGQTTDDPSVDAGIANKRYVDRVTSTNRTRSVATITAMQALSGLNDGDVVIVSGRTTAGDGGGGTHLWSAAATTTTNLGTIFARTASPATGRFTRITNGLPTKPEWWGAVPNDGVDDTIPFQSAADSLGLVGGKIEVSPGIWQFTNTVQIKPRTTIVGPSSGWFNADQTWTNRLFANGIATLISLDTTANYPIFTVSGTNAAALGSTYSLATTLNDGSYATNWYANVYIGGLNFTSGDATMTSPNYTNNLGGVFIDRCLAVTVENCAFTALAGHAIRTWACNALYIRGNAFTGVGGNGLFIDQTADSLFADNIGGGSIGPMMWVNSANKNTLADNFFFNDNNPLSFALDIVSVDTATDTITITNARTVVETFLTLGEPITFVGASLPAPLTTNRTYYAIPVSASSFKVNTQYTQGAAGGAMQSVALDLTTSVTGGVALSHGPLAVTAIHGVAETLLSGNKFDQAYQAGMIIANSGGVTLVGNQVQQSGYNNTNYTLAQVQVYSSTDSTITGNRFAGRAATGYAVNGVAVDSLSSRIQLVGNSFDSYITSRYVFEGNGGNSFSLNNVALPTTATDGFIYVPSTAGYPAGTPTTITGQVPLVANTSTYRLHAYTGSGWRYASLYNGGWSVSTSNNTTVYTGGAGLIPFTLKSEETGASQAINTYGSTASNGGGLDFVRFGGTVASPTPSTNGFTLGGFRFGGSHDGSTISYQASIAPKQTESWTTTAKGASVIIRATANGSTNQTDQLTVTGDNITVAGTIELGHATANTLSGSGGVLSVEGNAVPSPASPSTGHVPVWTNSAWASLPIVAGTVTSVAITVPTGLSVSGSPVTNSGTLAVTTSLNGVVVGNGSGFTAVAAPSGTIVGTTDTQTLSAKTTSESAALGSDDTFQGHQITGLNNLGGVTQWDAVYLNGSSQWVLADANGSGTYPARGLVSSDASTGNASSVITRGTIRNDAYNFTPGGTLYLSTTAGSITQTAPSTTGDKVQQIGFALTADIIFVDFASGEFLTVE